MCSNPGNLLEDRIEYTLRSGQDSVLCCTGASHGSALMFSQRWHSNSQQCWQNLICCSKKALQVLTDPGLLQPEEQEEEKKGDRDRWGTKGGILGSPACCFSCDKRDANGRAEGLKLYGGRSTKQWPSPFSLSWVAAAKQADFSGLWNSYCEQ